MDRFDLRLEVPPVTFQDLDMPPTGETSDTIRARVMAAWEIQRDRYEAIDGVRQNADATGALLEDAAHSTPEARTLLGEAAERFGISARGFHRIMRVSRTIADLAGAELVERDHMAEALSFRLSLRAG